LTSSFQVAVTATANEFAGVYRNKQYHPADFQHVLSRASAAGVKKIMLTGMASSDITTNAEIARSRPSECSMTVGVHPYHAAEPYAASSDGTAYYSAMITAMTDIQIASPGLVTAFGELGLDYDHLDHADKTTQLRCFTDQLELFVSHQFDLPLFLHCRAAFDDFVTTITPFLSHLPRRGLVHSFVGTEAQMRTLVSMGLDVSVNGFSFKDRESLLMVASLPLSHLQLETDAPWGIIQPSSEVAKRYLVNAKPLPASKKKDKWSAETMVKERNETCAMAQVAFVVAGLKAVSVEQVTDAAWQNSISMFWPNEA
jgi:TatD DNase family protein